MYKTTIRLKSALLASLMLMLPALSQAGELSKDQIAAAVSDRTYQGSMTKDAFAEYYAPDGTIRGKGYTGKWRTKADHMCFQYGEKPENCWKVTIQDTAMTMIKNGVVDGNGMLIQGNVYDY